MKFINNNNFYNILFFLGLFVAIYIINYFVGTVVFERIVTILFIYIILTVGLQIFMGNSGILSFAHIGFMCIGAYSSGLLSIPVKMKGFVLRDLYPVLQNVSLDPIISILIGGIFTAFVAAILTLPLMRLKDAAAVITSFALLMVIHSIVVGWSAVTNGPRTFFGIPKATTLELAIIFAFFAVTFAFIYKDSRFGLLLRATRDNDIAAESIGANIIYLRWFAIIASAFLAGIAGGLWGHFITSFSPKSFYLKETFLVISMLVIGGSFTVTGAIAGALLVYISFEILRWIEKVIKFSDYITIEFIGLTEVILAITMIIFLITKPKGLFAFHEIGDTIRKILVKKKD
jgi:branched-chain amino acid transport system permease protein